MNETDYRPEARFFGFTDARMYDRCDAAQHGFTDDAVAEYYEGYGQGMDVNLEVEDGLAPTEDQPCGTCDCCNKSVTPNTAKCAYGARLCDDCFDEISG